MKRNKNLLLTKTEMLIEKKRFESLSQLLFLAGICVGFFLNLAANIMYDLFIKQHKIVEVLVLLVAGVTLIMLSRWIYVFYISPINRADKLLKTLKRR